MFYDLVKKTRSFRRFKQEPAPAISQLERLVELARLAPATSNKQPIKYVLIQDSEMLVQVFSCLKWAGYLKDWSGPSEAEQPTAYIIFLSDPTILKNPGIDLGLAAQNVVLGAREMGFGACLIASVARTRLRTILGIPDDLKIELVAALGTPGEQVELTSVKSDGDIQYWRDEKGVHYVPKRPLGDLIIKKI